MRRFLALFAVLAAVSLAAGACGDDGEEAAGPESTYCKQLKTTAAEAVKPKTTTSAKDAAALGRAQEAEFNEVLAEIVDKAPEELEDDYEAFKEFVALRFELIRNPTLATSEPDRIKAVQEKYTPAAKAISDYNTKICEFQTSTTVAAPTATSSATTVKQ